MWWDARKLSEPTEVLILDLAKTENEKEPEWLKWARSHGVTCMDYDPSIPIRFMVHYVIIDRDIQVHSLGNPTLEFRNTF